MRGIKGWMPSKHFGELSFFRIYSGQITTGDDLFNASRNITERIGQIFLLNGRTRETVSRLGAGDIGATVKPKNTHTGDTLCAPNHPVKLPVPEYPHPNIHAALQPRAMGEEDKVAAGLATLRNEVLAGCRIVDVEANSYDGLMHPVDSKDIAFQVAGYWAFKEAFLLENSEQSKQRGPRVPAP